MKSAVTSTPAQEFHVLQLTLEPTCSLRVGRHVTRTCRSGDSLPKSTDSLSCRLDVSCWLCSLWEAEHVGLTGQQIPLCLVKMHCSRIPAITSA
jgi:hypothetical protein